MKKNLVLIASIVLAGLAVGTALARPVNGPAKSSVLAPVHAWRAAPQAAGDKKQPQWKSTEEYNAFQAVAGEKDSSKKLAAAEAFLAKYSTTDFKDLVYLQEVAAYQQLGDAGKMYQSSRKAIDASPDNAEAIYWACVSFPYAFKLTDANSAQELSQAEADARHGLEVLQKAQPPANSSPEQFAQQVKGFRALFNNTIGFVALQKKDYAAAITTFKLAAEDTPNDFTTFYRLGLSYWLSSPPDYTNAAWYMGRSASLARSAKNAFEAVVMKDLKQLYVGYHGSDAGLDDIITQAASSVNPPADFKVTPAERHKKTGNEAIDFYYNLEDTMKAGGDQAKQAWDQTKGQPFGYGGKVVTLEKGTDADTTMVGIAITDESKASGTADIILRDKQPDAKWLAKGDLLKSFKGDIAEYSLTPSYTLTMDGTIDDESIAEAVDKHKPKPKPRPVHHTTPKQ